QVPGIPPGSIPGLEYRPPAGDSFGKVCEIVKLGCWQCFRPRRIRNAAHTFLLRIADCGLNNAKSAIRNPQSEIYAMTASNFTVTASVVDIPGRRTSPAQVTVENGRIGAISESTARPTTYLLPGFIDAHVHVESSMLVPSEFARAAVVHGTVATVSDPHEIGN